VVLYSSFLSVCSSNSILVVALAGPAVFCSAVGCPHSSLALCRVRHVGGHVWPASVQVHVLAATQVVLSHGCWSEGASFGCLNEKLTARAQLQHASVLPLLHLSAVGAAKGGRVVRAAGMCCSCN
jgi:hypothetical protein